ncbi:unnamed protein product, partial [Ectocarpus sp. 12 AP-2014]
AHAIFTLASPQLSRSCLLQPRREGSPVSPRVWPVVASLYFAGFNCPSNQDMRKTEPIQQRGMSRQQATCRSLFRRFSVARATKTCEKRNTSNKEETEGLFFARSPLPKQLRHAKDENRPTKGIFFTTASNRQAKVFLVLSRD